MNEESVCLMAKATVKEDQRGRVRESEAGPPGGGNPGVLSHKVAF